MKKCPYCAEEIQDEAIKCRFCGESIEKAKGQRVAVDSTLSSTPQGSPLLKFLGALLFLGGVAFAIYYFNYFDTTVATPTLEVLGEVVGGGRVHNIGLLQQRQNGLIVSSIVAVVGLVLVAVADRLGGASK